MNRSPALRIHRSRPLPERMMLYAARYILWVAEHPWMRRLERWRGGTGLTLVEAEERANAAPA